MSNPVEVRLEYQVFDTTLGWSSWIPIGPNEMGVWSLDAQGYEYRIRLMAMNPDRILLLSGTYPRGMRQVFMT